MSKFYNLIEEIVKHNIPVSLEKDINDYIYADLNFGTKSHAYLYKNDDIKLILKTRYDEDEEIQDFHDLMCKYKEFYHYKSFGSSFWMDVCLKYGIMKVSSKTTYHYE